MATSTFLKFACAVFMCMVVVAPHAEAAMTCSAVTKNIASCISYLKGGSSPSDACCTGIKALKNLASTPADKKTACNCLKSAASSMKGLVEKNAAALPGSCGVSIPYSISPQTDCSKISDEPHSAFPEVKIPTLHRVVYASDQHHVHHTWNVSTNLIISLGPCKYFY